MMLALWDRMPTSKVVANYIGMLGFSLLNVLFIPTLSVPVLASKLQARPLKQQISNNSLQSFIPCKSRPLSQINYALFGCEN